MVALQSPALENKNLTDNDIGQIIEKKGRILGIYGGIHKGFNVFSSLTFLKGNKGQVLEAAPDQINQKLKSNDFEMLGFRSSGLETSSALEEAFAKNDLIQLKKWSLPSEDIAKIYVENRDQGELKNIFQNFGTNKPQLVTSTPNSYGVTSLCDKGEVHIQPKTVTWVGGPCVALPVRFERR